MKFAALLLVTGLFASTVNAGALVGDPFSTTTWNADGNQQVVIRDDGKKDGPAFKSLNCAVDLMTGNDQQVKVDTIDKGVKLTADPTIVKYKPKATLGPAGKFYFVRLTCDPNKFTAYSARFTINGIKGTVAGLDPAAPVKEPAATTPDPTDNTTGGSAGNGTSTGGGFGTTTSASNSASSPTSASSASSPSETSSKSASSLTNVASSALLSAALGFIGLAFTFIC